jgi:hypothetical protein
MFPMAFSMAFDKLRSLTGRLGPALALGFWSLGPAWSVDNVPLSLEDGLVEGSVG